MNTLEKILQLIKEKDIYEKDFLIDMGLNRATLSDWKSGKSKSYLKYIPKIADYFNVSPNYLLTGKENTSTDYILTSDEQQLIGIYRSSDREDRAKILEYAQLLNGKNKK